MKSNKINFNDLSKLTQLLSILAPVVITGQSHPGQDASQTHIVPPQQQQAFQQSSYTPMAPQTSPYPPASSPYSANATTVPMAAPYPTSTYPTSPYPVSAAPYPTSQPIGGMPMPELPTQGVPFNQGAPYPPVNPACPYPPATNFANPPTYNEAVTNDYPKQMPYNPAYNPDFKG